MALSSLIAASSTVRTHLAATGVVALEEASISWFLDGAGVRHRYLKEARFGSDRGRWP